MKTVLAAFVVCVLVQGSKAIYCLKKTISVFYPYYTPTYIYCSYICCGSGYSTYCCGSSSYYNLSTGALWSIGAIGGAAIAGLIGLCILICIIINIAKAATKSGSRGRVVQLASYPTTNPNVTVASSHYNSNYPQPYAGPGVTYPPPTHAGPGVTYPQTAYAGPAVPQPPPTYTAPGE